MRVQLLAAALGLAMLWGVASQVVAQQTVPVSEGASVECPSDDMMEDDMMEDDMMEDDMMEDDIAGCPVAKPKT